MEIPVGAQTVIIPELKLDAGVQLISVANQPDTQILSFPNNVQLVSHPKMEPQVITQPIDPIIIPGVQQISLADLSSANLISIPNTVSYIPTGAEEQIIDSVDLNQIKPTELFPPKVEATLYVSELSSDNYSFDYHIGSSPVPRRTDSSLQVRIHVPNNPLNIQGIQLFVSSQIADQLLANAAGASAQFWSTIQLAVGSIFKTTFPSLVYHLDGPEDIEQLLTQDHELVEPKQEEEQTSPGVVEEKSQMVVESGFSTELPQHLGDEPMEESTVVVEEVVVTSEASFQSVEEQVAVLSSETLTPVLQSDVNVSEKMETDDSATVLINNQPEAAHPAKSDLVVCWFCKFPSPDRDVCPRCRRNPLKCPPPPPPPPLPVEPTSSAESTISPTKSDREEKHSRSRCHHKRRRNHVSKKKEPVEEEPISILLSSDDDESTETSIFPPPWKTKVYLKEPVITAESEGIRETLYGGGVDLERLMDHPEHESIRLECRSVRFGSYKVVPQDKIILTEQGLKLKVPSLNKSSSVIVRIYMKDIVKLLVHFGKTGAFSNIGAPAFFYYLTYEASKRIREALHMTQKNKNYYFDPTSKEEQHKRITLLPETVSVEDRLFIKSIYESRCLMEEITWDETNDILIRAAPSNIQNTLKKDSSGVKPLPQLSETGIQQIMIYPPPPVKGGISINTEDYGCLKEDQFLNDVIIDFYLKYLWLHILSDEDRERTHIFSSFFYNKLTGMRPRNFATKDNLSAAEKRHFRVKAWTKSVNIFQKDFVVVPINEKAHWFLAIICFPGLDGPVRMSDNTPVPQLPTKKRKGENVLSGGKAPAKLYGTTISIVPQAGAGQKERTSERQLRSSQLINVEPEEEKEESDRDEAEAAEDELEPDTTDEEAPRDDDLMDEATHPPRVSRVRPQLEPIKQPCILIFDSLAGCNNRAKVVATLREYLQVEWNVHHKGKPKDFSSCVIKGACPKVPQQPNFVDCGLYLLQFVESFFQNPIEDYRMPIRSIKDWFPNEVVARKRYEISQLLLKLMREQNIDIASLNLPQLELEDYEMEDGGEEEEFEEEALPEEEEEEEAEEEEEEEEEGVEAYQPPPRQQQVQTPVQQIQHQAVKEVKASRASSHQVSSPSKSRFEGLSRMEKAERLPSPRSLEARPEITVRSAAEVRPEPSRQPDHTPPPRPRLPDSVTIISANSKASLPLSLKDFRNPRLSSQSPVSNSINKANLEKVKKPRVE